MSDREVARDIRRDVEAGGGSRWVPVRMLRDAFGRSTLTRKARAEIAAALSEVGVQAEPDLETVALNNNVRLYLAERARVRDSEDALPPVGAGWFPDPEDARLVRYWDGAAWTEHRRPAVAPAPAWTPAPGPPNAWRRFRAWPPWAQLAAGAAALILVVAVAAGDDSGDGGDSDPPPAQEAATPDSADEDDDEAEERERARERKRERARERERIREKRRERRRREEARERREREATPPPAEEEPEPPSDCDPNYSGCVPPYPPDVDCPDVDGPVTVTGSDPHGLDADNDGEGCEN